MAEWENFHELSKEELSELENKWEPSNRLDQVLHAIDKSRGKVAIGLVAVVAFGFQLAPAFKKHYSPMPERTKTELAKNIKPTAQNIGREVAELAANHPSEVSVKEIPTSPGVVELRFDSFDTWEWYTVTARMVKNKKGEFEPATTSDVDVKIADYVNDGRDFYGGSSSNQQEIELISYADMSGSDIWMTEDTQWAANFKGPTQDVFSLPQTELRLSDVAPSSPIIEEGVRKNTLWSRYDQTMVDEALAGDIQQVPKPKANT